jgi:exopolysaccharide biosynthesis WecB/TagA/CpsF family protein
MSKTCSQSDARLSVAARRSSALWQPKTAKTSPTLSLFGVPLANTFLDTATRDLILAARYERRTRVVFVNAHVVNEMASDENYRAIVASADRAYADGSGLAVAARMAGTPLADNVNGTDLFPLLARAASESEIGIYLLGGAPGVADDASQRLKHLRIGGAIVGTHHGHFHRTGAEQDAVIAAINASGAKIVLVGLGVPLQDQWIAATIHRLDAPVVIGVGGLFDYFAGRVSRAPHALRVIGMEWAWRLLLEPRRLARRYLVGNIKFLALATREAIAQRLKRSRQNDRVPAVESNRA